MFCYKCGTQSAEEDVFCRNCGVKLIYVSTKSQMQDASASVVSLFETRSIDPSIPEETREAYDMLVRSAVPRPKCIRKIKPRKGGILIKGYVHMYVLPPCGTDYSVTNAVLFVAGGWLTALITGMRNSMRCSLSWLALLAPFFLFPSFIFDLLYDYSVLLRSISFLTKMIIFFSLNIYAYKEEKEIMIYINEVLNRDEDMPSIIRYCAIGIIVIVLLLAGLGTIFGLY